MVKKNFLMAVGCTDSSEMALRVDSFPVAKYFPVAIWCPSLSICAQMQNSSKNSMYSCHHLERSHCNNDHWKFSVLFWPFGIHAVGTTHLRDCPRV